MRRWLLPAILTLLIICIVFKTPLRRIADPLITQIKGAETVESRLETFGNAARDRMKNSFEAAGVAYPPAATELVGIKNDRVLHVYAGDDPNSLVHVIAYPVQGQSGVLGPKLREGDRQVPEGIYQIDALNPNSSFYVSMRLNYPNAWDSLKAKLDGRDQPGSDIYIHGQSASIGCLAMGDRAIEELFTLVADVGREQVKVIIAPVDFRVTETTVKLPQDPPWISELYVTIDAEMRRLPMPKS